MANHFSVFLVVFMALAADANAEVVFVSRLVPCGAPGTSAGCGSNPGARDKIEKGSIRVESTGKVVLHLSGAVPKKQYLVLLHNWTAAGGPQPQFAGRGTVCPQGFGEFSAVTTDSKGNFSGILKDISTRKDFVFPPGTMIGQANFVLNDRDCGRTQFTSGFLVAPGNRDGHTTTSVH